MIHSMTAFARQERQGEWGAIQLELRSVNHRYLELSPRLPDELRVLETRLRERLAQGLSRGKVECTLRYQPPQEASSELQLNLELVRRLAHASREIDGIVYNPAPLNSLELLRWPGVIETRRIDQEALHQAVLETLALAIDELRASRAREGASLKTVILQRCDAAEAAVKSVQQRLPEIISGQRQRLLNRLQELSQELDPARIEQEIALLAQKIDVAEELDRLSMHINEVRRVLEASEPVGRRLDFLMQELNREANTLGSKSIDSDTTRASVDLKVLIEQMREQIQNIE